MRETIDEITARLDGGEVTARTLAENCLERIADRSGEGARAFLEVQPGKVRSQADAVDIERAAGIRRGPLAGIPISVKDLLDVAGEVTRAGSKVLADAAPAARDAAAVARLRAAGAVIVGRTNMTEFAYGGIGFNPHYGTPAAPYDRATGRVPGGSSSGAAVSVADGMAQIGIGTDTGGSCRIPAAFCGVVGFKPTARRVPLEGCFPLSPSLDSIGPLASSVADVALVDAVLAGEPAQPLLAQPAGGLRLLVPTSLVLDGLEAPVAAAFDAALARLAAAGARIERRRVPAIERYPDAFRHGGIAGAESFAFHARLLAENGGLYDPKVRARIEASGGQSAKDYLDLLAFRRGLVAEFDVATRDFDAVAMPTVAMLPPPIADFGDHQRYEDYGRVNALSLRNTYVANIMDRCSISLPLAARGEPPVGLMLIGERGADRRLLAAAAGIEAALGEPARRN
jgi:aspartyl-tRNA(Asn)/glutamyl-tRNA(Gln) amidotransferase subunit A